MSSLENQGSAEDELYNGVADSDQISNILEPFSSMDQKSAGDSQSQMKDQPLDHNTDLNGQKSDCNDSECDAGYSEEPKPGLDSLPPEVFLTICSFLPPTFILTQLTLVCRSFYDLLMDDATWKIRISKLCQKLYPRIPGEGNLMLFTCYHNQSVKIITFLFSTSSIWYVFTYYGKLGCKPTTVILNTN